MGSIPLLLSLEDPRGCIAIPLFYGTLLLAFMSIFYQRIGNKMATIRDIRLQYWKPSHAFFSDPSSHRSTKNVKPNHFEIL